MSSTTARVWLVIAHGGGRWTYGELRAALPQDNHSTIGSVLDAMRSKSCLEQYEPCENSKFQRYGVTPACRVPRGVSAWDVVEAMGLQLRPGVDEGELVKGMTVAEVLRKMAVQRAVA